MADVYGFSKPGIQEVIGVVKQFRTTPPSRNVNRSSYNPSTKGLLIRIDEQNEEDKRQYSWTQMVWRDLLDEDDEPQEPLGEADDSLTGTFEDDGETYAVERYGSEAVVPGDIVEIFPTPKGYYEFEYRPQKKIAKLTGTGNVTAGNSSAPGEGTVTIVKLVDGDYEDTETEITVLNTNSQIEAEDGKLLQIAYFPVDKAWFVDVEGCG